MKGRKKPSPANDLREKKKKGGRPIKGNNQASFHAGEKKKK